LSCPRRGRSQRVSNNKKKGGVGWRGKKGGRKGMKKVGKRREKRKEKPTYSPIEKWINITYETKYITLVKANELGIH
jgi:hypothetical protein